MQPTTILYLIVAAAVLMGIRLLSSPRYAWTGNVLGAVAILVAIILVTAQQQLLTTASVLIALAIGSVVGGALAIQVKMIQMPQLVALLNGCGGAASGLIALSEAFGPNGVTATLGTFAVTGLAVSVGAFTFSGSMVAAGKLHGVFNERAVILPRHSWLAMAIGAVVVVYWALGAALQLNGIVWYTIVLLLLALAYGVVVTIRIGGADMPVVITFLNAASGVAASLCGFVTDNALLVACGAMVGASGVLLSHKMCRAMNRSLKAVFLSFEAAPAETAGSGAVCGGSRVVEEKADALGLSVGLLQGAKDVIIVPGYGMALAQAQASVKQLADRLEARGALVRYAIHPVAGRMPGHMNVLLCEVDVPYDQLYEMDAINGDFATCDLVIIVGANDVVNPAARFAEGTPIYGMPVLAADQAPAVIICNFDDKPGYAGVPNPLYDSERTILLPGDAKDTLEALLSLI